MGSLQLCTPVGRVRHHVQVTDCLPPGPLHGLWVWIPPAMAAVLWWLLSTLSAREVLKPWLLLSTDTDTDPVLLYIPASPLPLWPGLPRVLARGVPRLNPRLRLMLRLILTTDTDTPVWDTMDMVWDTMVMVWDTTAMVLDTMVMDTDMDTDSDTTDKMEAFNCACAIVIRINS